ncbi:MAG: AbrB/MazE/SpoVT family DNA-binding domain-containing protein [Agitococcus sp.]|nr:AbrB/MazE/SpoVT family DNA-binding domain-containing protein [Agitococcus sp.]MCC6373566.1 AbrB/MazE/SpoVT family DNA-binding domain-containing protein [Moraxellaceae bacterium]HQV80891.1 type II toxin-antitoxin system VapB family antitoxin [Agitococcus sp.]
MRTVSIFKNGHNQAVRLPKDMEFSDVAELEIVKVDDVITLRPIRPSWQSLSHLPAADDDFLQERPTIMGDEGRF